MIETKFLAHHADADLHDDHYNYAPKSKDSMSPCEHDHPGSGANHQRSHDHRDAGENSHFHHGHHEEENAGGHAHNFHS